MEINTHDGSQPVSYTSSYEIATNKRYQRYRRLRALAVHASGAAEPHAKHSFWYYAIVVTASMAFVMSVAVLNSTNSTSMILNFFSTYRQHYQSIVYDCKKSFETSTMLGQVRREKYLNQDWALRQLERAFRDNSYYKTIAFVGPDGVGKTLLAQLIAQHFPHPNNVHLYDWNTYVPIDSWKMDILQMFVRQLSSCGQNLLVIDNLAPCEKAVLGMVKKYISKEAKNGTLDGMKSNIVAIFIFSFNSMDEQRFDQEYNELIEGLTDAKVITFRKFDRKELKDCIMREASLGNLTLHDSAVREIMATVNVERTGCKNVRAKVLSYGKSQIKTD